MKELLSAATIGCGIVLSAETAVDSLRKGEYLKAVLISLGGLIVTTVAAKEIYKSGVEEE